VAEILRGAEAKKARLPYFFHGPVMAKVNPDFRLFTNIVVSSGEKQTPVSSDAG
jgi:hypothetical protein